MSNILCFKDGKLGRGRRLQVVEDDWSRFNHGVVTVIEGGVPVTLYEHPDREDCLFNWDRSLWYYGHKDTKNFMMELLELGMAEEYLRSIYPAEYFEEDNR